MVKIKLSQRAMFDLHAIKAYSINHFGEKIADQYIDAIEAALLMIQEQPDLLNSKQDVNYFFQFYKVRKHYLICTKTKNIIIVLTIKHCQMNLPERLLELEPDLLLEAQLLYEKLTTKK